MRSAYRHSRMRGATGGSHVHTKTLTEWMNSAGSVFELDDYLVGVDDVQLTAEQFAHHIGICAIPMK